MAIGDKLQSFIWGDAGQALTPEQVAERRRRAESMSQQEVPGLGHWAAVLNQGLTGFMSGREERAADAAEQAGIDAYSARRADSILGGGGSGQVDPVAAVLSGASPAEPYSMPSGDMAEMVRSGLIARGLPDHVSDALVMNLNDESGLNPGINEAAPIVPGSRGGFGLAQWTGPRRNNLEAFAQSRGVSPADLDMQLDFLVDELKGSESAAARDIFAAKDVPTAADAVLRKFLRPAPEHQASRSAKYLGGARTTAGGSNDIAQLLAISSDPWAPEGDKRVAQALMQQEMGRQDALFKNDLAQQDPMRQLEMQKAQLELDALRNPQVKPIEVGGVLLDPTTYQPLFDSRAPQAGYSQISPEQAAARGLNPNEQWQLSPDGKVEKIGGAGVTVNNNMGGDKFGEEFAKLDAKQLSDIGQQGQVALANLGRIDQLEGLLSQSPQGLGGAAVQIAGNLGMDLGDVTSNVQAAEALINQMVPQQRPAGSGTMSDADLALFKRSLPRLINSPEGNALIIKSMRGIAQYDADRGAVLDRLRNNEISRSDAFKEISSIPNPLSSFKNESDAMPETQAPAEPAQPKSKAEFDALPSGATFIAPDGTTRRKP